MSAITFYIAAFVPPSLIYFLVKAFKYPQWIHPPQLLDYFSKNSRLLAEINGSEDIRNSLDEASANDELVKNYFRYMATARRRCLNWNKTDSLQHALVECDSLRQEIADIKQRETSSERFVSGGLAAVATFIFLGDIQGAQALFLSLVILVFTLFGFWRFREYQRNNFEIDCYLRERERDQSGRRMGLFLLFRQVSHKVLCVENLFLGATPDRGISAGHLFHGGHPWHPAIYARRSRLKVCIRKSNRAFRFTRG